MYQYHTDQEAPKLGQEGHLTQQLPAELEEDLGAFCDVVDPFDDIARSVLANGSLAVTLTMLHIRSLAEKHLAASVRKQQTLEPRFAAWLEAHSTKDPEVDRLVVEALARPMSTHEIERAVDEYLQIVGMLDSSLEHQVVLNIECLEKVIGKTLTEKERDELRADQRQAIRRTYLGSGMTHPAFLRILERLSPNARKRVEQIAPAYC